MFNIEFILVTYIEGTFSVSSYKEGNITSSINQSVEEIIDFLNKKEKERSFLKRKFTKLKIDFSSKNISLKQIKVFEDQLKLVNKNIKLII